MVAQEKSVQEQNIATKDKLLLGLKEKNRFMLIAAVFLIIIVVVLAIIFINLLLANSKKSPQNSTMNYPTNNVSNNNIPTSATTPTLTPKPTPKPTPTPRPFPSGPQSYSVGSKTSIQVKNLTISALDTKIGDSQNMSLTIQDSQGKIVSVSVKIISDHKSQDIVITRSSVTNLGEIWQGTWVTNDTHDYNYQAEITIKDDKSTVFSFTPTFR